MTDPALELAAAMKQENERLWARIRVLEAELDEATKLYEEKIAVLEAALRAMVDVFLVDHSNDRKYELDMDILEKQVREALNHA